MYWGVGGSREQAINGLVVGNRLGLTFSVGEKKANSSANLFFPSCSPL